MSVLEKVKLYTKGLVVSIIYRIRYGKRIKMSMLNPISGLLSIKLSKDARISIGKKLRVDGPLYIKSEAELSIGNNCYFNHNCSITALRAITIGDECYFANNVVIVDHDHMVIKGHIVHDCVSEGISIGDNVWIGANTTILKGVSIGTGTIVGAGSVVTKNIPEHSIVVGVPARVVKSLL